MYTLAYSVGLLAKKIVLEIVLVKRMLDYTTLRKQNSCDKTWKDLIEYNDFALDVQLWVRRCVCLPENHYDLISAYILLPSALCRIVPYLFLHGQSGSGKSTVGKLIASIYNVDINSSSDTFAAIRNSLNKRKYGSFRKEVPESATGFMNIETEVNTCMVWDDVDPGTFKLNPDIYKLFKYGYDRASDKIMISSKDAGENLEFRCFCPKVFSSISPLHNLEDFKELRRRLLVIPFTKLEDLPDTKRLYFEAINSFNPDDIDWFNCNKLLTSLYWDLDRCESWLDVRRDIKSKLTKLNSNQTIICSDLAATGVVTGIWNSTSDANKYLADYFAWLDKDIETSKDSLLAIIERIIKQESDKAKGANITLAILNQTFRNQLNNYYDQGWINDKPTSKAVGQIMIDRGFKLRSGYWEKK
jgi:hypothetical protein